jgi:transcriptional regulator with XRE-family HTH domain
VSFTIHREKLPMQFGEKMKELREAKGLTQAALASSAGLSVRTLQSWEQNHRAPVSPDFFKLVRALGVSADVFAGCVEGAAAPKQARKRKGK